MGKDNEGFPYRDGRIQQLVKNEISCAVISINIIFIYYGFIIHDQQKQKKIAEIGEMLEFSSPLWHAIIHFKISILDVNLCSCTSAHQINHIK